MQGKANPTLLETLVTNPLAIVPAAGAIIGILLALRKIREDSLRRGEVVDWTNDCIATLESLIVAAILFNRSSFVEECRKRLINVAFDAPALIERGRIFFKNQPYGDFGKEKESAYRGVRPKILDPLVAAHQIAIRFVESDEETQIRLQLVAEDYLRMFVSLVQKEIGRDRTAAAETKQAGSGFKLEPVLDAIPVDRVDGVRRARRQKLSDYRKRPQTRPD